MRKVEGNCCIEGCGKLIYSRGWCRYHYARWYRNGEPVRRLKAKKDAHIGQTCEVLGCENEQRWIGLCKIHYHREKRSGRTYTIKREDGTGTISPQGYKIITINGIRKHEHTYLAEKALGKQLPDRAEVHHMNGNKLDNYTPFNLIICPSRAYHMLLHKRMRDGTR